MTEILEEKLKKIKKEPILLVTISRDSELLLSWVILQCQFVSSVTSDYNINSKKWDLDKLPKCFNFQKSDFTVWIRVTLMGYIQGKGTVIFNLVKISK